MPKKWLIGRTSVSVEQVGLEPAQRVLGGEFEHVVGELVGLVELVARDRVERGEVLLRPRAFSPA